MLYRLVLTPFLALAPGFAQNAPAPPVSLAVHLVIACSSPKAGQAVNLPGVEPSLCLDKTPFLTEKDVQSAELHNNSKGRPMVFLTFHDAAAMRELDITRKNVGNRVGIVVNGRVISAPTIASSSRLLYIDGNYTEPQVQALVAAFNKMAGSR